MDPRVVTFRLNGTIFSSSATGVSSRSSSIVSGWANLGSHLSWMTPPSLFGTMYIYSRLVTHSIVRAVFGISGATLWLWLRSGPDVKEASAANFFRKLRSKATLVPSSPLMHLDSTTASRPRCNAPFI
ncbi:hypothetical protein MIND_00278200 [Mycena indigotica]|uniref:Uncharacterized protein n=1 Tax=Mycena indigotica TaxID=2126181 RepID=A0A8H6T9F9_9AGAR|nr:uncharacterized protein MIND_00278200 [Mycena indigotica]KAF7312641.1 hypothetical protein MIND_00278200 [Mycena indigotica]